MSKVSEVIKNNKSIFIIIGTIIAISLLIIGLNFYKSSNQKTNQMYEPVSVDEYLIVKIDKIIVKKDSKNKIVDMILNIENISKGFQSGIYQYELVKTDKNNKIETRIVPNKNKAESKINSQKILGNDEGVVYGDPILASTQVKMVLNYKIPLDDELNEYSLSLHNTPEGKGMPPTIINLE